MSHFENTQCNLAIQIVNATKTFQNGNVKVIQNLNLRVPRNSIYTLLSSSGAGKTQVSKYCLGLVKFDEGHIRVLGRSDISQIRHLIGYMPQETALYDNFSIKETLVYFGSLFSGTRKCQAHFSKGIEFLQKLLSLPNLDKLVGNLSGGQQRRVSLAVSLIHEPHVLLLDEPTTGMDPLIRESIWNHLRFLACEKGTTVVLTTHYVDEANRADLVGVLRHGKLLAEESPNTLTERLQVDTLDDAILTLCKSEKHQECTIFSNETQATNKICMLLENENRRGQSIIVAAAKQWKLFFRNVWLLSFMLLTPPVAMLLIGYAFDNDFNGITVTVVNYDNDHQDCIALQDFACEPECLSTIFLENLSTKFKNLLVFDDIYKARESVELGDSFGLIHIPKNFSNALSNKYFEAEYSVPKNSLEFTDIVVNLDRTNRLVHDMIVKVLHESFAASLERILAQCGMHKGTSQYPLKYLDPILGSKEMNYFHYLAPGFYLITIFCLNLQTSILVIKEKRQGTMSRCLAGGVKLPEILIGLVLQDTPVLICQCALAYLALHYGFSLGASPLASPLNFLAICSIGVLQGISGLLFGFVLGLLSSTEKEASMILVSINFPLGTFSGLFWPREGMHEVLQWISYFNALSLSSDAARSLMVRPNEFFHDSVWQGSASLVFFIIFPVCWVWLIIKKRYTV